MQDQIGTLWHKVCEAILEGRVGVHRGMATESVVNKRKPGQLQNGRDVNYDEVLELPGMIAPYPMFRLDRDLAARVPLEDINKTVEQLFDAGMIHVPFPVFTIEIDGKTHADGYVRRTFVIITDRKEIFGDTPDKWTRISLDEYPFCAMVVRLMAAKEFLPEMALLCPQVIAFGYTRTIGPDKDEFGLKYQTYNAPWMIDSEYARDAARRTVERDLGTIEIALGTILCLMRTRGTVQVHTPAPAKLNKGRIASGKPAIPAVTVLRIGQTFDRNGEAIAHASGDRRYTGLPVWVMGHNKMQAFGPQRSQRKPIHIAPYWRNLEGDEPPEVSNRRYEVKF